MRNIFVYGLSGAGKDEVSRILFEYYKYLELRIAGTIKQNIMEKNNLTFDELEVKKRVDPNIRTLHHEEGYVLDETNGTENRIKQIINRTSFDFKILNSLSYIDSDTKTEIPIKQLPIFITDVRTIEEAKLFLEAGYVGIYLTRQPKEFRELKHKTEANIFNNGSFNELFKNNPDNIYLVNNCRSVEEFDDLNIDIVFEDTFFEVPYLEDNYQEFKNTIYTVLTEINRTK